VLSIRRLQKQREKQEKEQLMEQYSSTSRGFTIGEVVGMNFVPVTSEGEPSSKKEEEAEQPPVE